MDQRFEFLDRSVQAFMRRQRKRLHMQHVTQESVGIDSLVKCPAGAWQKGQDTRWLLAFLEDWFAKNNTGDFTYMEMASRSINLCFSTLYRSGLFMTKYEASLAATMGCDFLKYYSLLADAALRDGKDRWPMHPKLHYLAHIFRTLQEQSVASDWSLNPLCFSVQADED